MVRTVLSLYASTRRVVKRHGRETQGGPRHPRGYALHCGVSKSLVAKVDGCPLVDTAVVGEQFPHQGPFLTELLLPGLSLWPQPPGVVLNAGLTVVGLVVAAVAIGAAVVVVLVAGG
jgi:hypothetical protein